MSHESGSLMRCTRVLACVVAAGMAFALDVPAVGADNGSRHAVGCGTVITRDTELHSDLIDCPADGLLIGADNIELDLNGHTIDGVQSGQANSDADGVDNSAGHRGVTIRDGAIRQFASGAYLDGGATDNRLHELDVSENYVGIDIARSTNSEVTGNQSHDNGLAGIRLLLASGNEVTGNSVSKTPEGIDVLGAPGNQVTGNSIASTSFGIFLDNADGNRVAGNSVKDSESDGIDLFRGSDGNTVTHNSVRRSASTGMQISSATDNHIAFNVVKSSPAGFGVALFGGAENRLDHNFITDNPGNPGLFLAGTNGNEVRDNVSSRNDIGIAVAYGASDNALIRNFTSMNGNVGIGVGGIGPDTTGTQVEGNFASRNTDSGIVVREPGSVLRRNAAYRNGNLGIDASAGVVDGGGNRAAGNGNTLQCSGVDCSARWPGA